MEGVVDVEAAREVESVQLNSLVSKGFELGVDGGMLGQEGRCWSGGIKREIAKQSIQDCKGNRTSSLPY